MVAIENDRCSSVPGMRRSAYWPGLNSKVAGSMGASRSDTMSRVIGSTAITRVRTSWIGTPAEEFVLVEVEELDGAVAERM